MREFTLLGFASFVASLPAAVEAEERALLTEAARIVEREAKAEIGHYQDAAGPFAAWPELADATKADRLKLGFTENDPGLRTGEMRESIGHTVLAHEAHVGSDDDKLVWFEMGTDKQPPRSVLGSAAVHKESEVIDLLGSGVVAVLSGGSKAIPSGGGEGG